MATIRDYLRGNIGETYEKMVTVGKYTGGSGQDERPDIFGQKIDAVTSLIFKASVDPEEDLDEFSKGFVADLATLDVIPACIDYWQVQGRLTVSVGPPGRTELGGENDQLYDRIRGLQALEKSLSAKVARDAAAFRERVANLLYVGQSARADTGMQISTTKEQLLTPDPSDYFSRVRYGGSLQTSYPFPPIASDDY